MALQNGHELDDLFTIELNKAFTGAQHTTLADMRAEAAYAEEQFGTPEEYHLAGGAIFDLYLIAAGDTSFIIQDSYFR